MGLVSSRSNNAEAEDLSDDLGGLARAVHAVVGELVRRQSLRVEGAEAGLVAEKRPTSHGHAAGKKHFDRGIEPKNRNASEAQELRATRLRIGSAAEGEDGSLLEFGAAADGGAKLFGFKLAEINLTQALENLRDGKSGGFFYAIVEIHKAPSKLAGQKRANGGLAGTHETGEAKNRDTRETARRRCSCHTKEARRAKKLERH